jgi:hypothetical protein
MHPSWADHRHDLVQVQADAIRVEKQEGLVRGGTKRHTP